MQNKVIVAPSILAADWGRLREELIAVTKAGADWIHIDVMDGHFVPPITFGPKMVEAAKKATDLPLDVHLMIERPEQQLEAFVRAGASRITVHQEACPHLHRTLQRIHELGVKAGVALNPGTPVGTIADLIDDIELLLIMTVNPGWGGQEYIPHSTAKIAEAASLIKKSGRATLIEVDGGITPQTAAEARKAGANVLVAGTSVFGTKDYRAALEGLKSA